MSVRLGRENRKGVGVLLVIALAMVGAACSSSPGNQLSAQQRAAIGEVAAAFDAAEATTASAFDAVVVVPKLERWQETEDRHQAALRALRDGLPAGECRASIEKLLVVEDGQNVIRRRLIEDYRQEKFGIVAKDATDYGASVINGAYQAEDAVAEACGRSSVTADKVTARAAALTPAQNSLFDAVLAAYAETRVAFDAAFSVSRFVTDLEALQAADASVRAVLQAQMETLGEGACRSSLSEILDIEKQQEVLRVAMIAAGKAGDTVKMLTTLDQYTAINSTSAPFVELRRTAFVNCGGKD